MSRMSFFRRWVGMLLNRRLHSDGMGRGVNMRMPSFKRHSRPRLEQLEDRLAPATTLSIADASTIEPSPGGTANMVFTVTRTGDLTAPLTVGYTTVADTAQPGADFTPETGIATFAAGSATATIAIPIFGNAVYNNPSLTFFVKLTDFAPEYQFATGAGPIAVALGDVNGDGKPDLALADYADNSVCVLLNTTAPSAAVPTFASKKTFTTGRGPTSVVLSDLNGDGKLDLVVNNFRDKTVSVLLNTTEVGASAPTFAPQQAIPIAHLPFNTVVADVNGDGKPDLIFPACRRLYF